MARQQALDVEILTHQESLKRASNFTNQARRSSVTVFPLEMFNNFQRRLKGEIELLAERKREEAQELEAKRNALVEAKRAQRTLEILKEKEQRRYDQEMNRRERLAMDEVARNYFFLQTR
jgi:flagellar export protein FliJ